ncbi:MAG: M16 family metallopeptidase [Pseudanabaenaceae cyanobacterium]
MTTTTYVDCAAGVSLVCQYLPTEAVSVDIWVGAGSAHEVAGEYGIAHLLEHMLFRGTEFDFVIESQGGDSNAATSLDYTHFSFTIPSQGLGYTLPYLANMLMQPRFSLSDLEQERQVVLEEIAQCADDPDWQAYQLLQATAYGEHPYGRSVLGSPAVVASITLEQLFNFHRQFYVPENITIAVAGGVDVESVKTIVEETFLDTVVQPTAGQAPVSARSGRQTVYLEQLQYSRLMLSWLGAGANTWQDGIQLDVLAMLLAGGRSSRLFRQLREEWGWVYDIDCGFALQRQAGLFTISACLDYPYLEPVEHHILTAVEALARGEVSASELTRAKRSLINNFYFSMESPQTLASFLGYHTLLGCHELCTNWAEAYKRLIAQVSLEDVQRLASTYLRGDRSIVVSALAG